MKANEQFDTLIDRCYKPPTRLDFLPILRLHRPMGRTAEGATCEGCGGEYATPGEPSWPCRTVEVIAEELNCVWLLERTAA